MKENIGESIRKRRLQCEFTQSQLARAAGMSEISIRRYESGARIPTNAQIAKIEAALSNKCGETTYAERPKNVIIPRSTSKGAYSISRQRLRLCMAKKCMSGHDLSKASGISSAAISKILNEKHNPYPSTIGKLAKALGCDVSYLMGIDETSDEKTPSKA